MARKSAKKEDRKNGNLPKYLMLAKGSMWLDDISGVKIYAFSKVFLGRSYETKVVFDERTGKEIEVVVATDIPKEQYNDQNILDHNKGETDLPWYFDVDDVPSDKLSRIMLAYNYGILKECDPDNPPERNRKSEPSKDFKNDKSGDRIFVGKNKEMYVRLQNMNFSRLRTFIRNFPVTSNARENLMDMYEYEKKGYNSLSRPRGEVLDLIRDKLNDYGPGMGPIRKNEDD